MNRVECPRCGTEVAAGDECSACGIVFQKFRERRLHGRHIDGDPAPPPPPEARSGMTTLLLVLLAIAVAILAYGELRPDPAPEVIAMPDPAPQPARTRPAEVAPRAEAPPPPPPPPPPARPAPAPRQPRAEPPPAQAAASPAPRQLETRTLTPSYDWYEGADGFAEALQEARADGRPIAVYFYTEWCGYCRQLEGELLTRAKVESYMKYMTKVRLNPESGANERFIAERYGVTGYPSFFVHPSAAGGPTKVGGMKRRAGEWQLKTPDEFVASLRRAAEE